MWSLCMLLANLLIKLTIPYQVKTLGLLLEKVGLAVRCNTLRRGFSRCTKQSDPRMLIGLHRFCSASSIFTQAHVDGFHVIIRQKSASILCRVRARSNIILKTIAGRYDSSLLNDIVYRCLRQTNLLLNIKFF